MGNYFVRETADYVDGVVSAENALVPDAAFILENRRAETSPVFPGNGHGNRADRQHESSGDRLSLHYKFEQYDRYLNSMRYAQKYKL